ncbi:alpha-galactosidase [Salipaludibacillus aurantiacus]|uniref:Alpha-galactosidase n=1 Tax=Salipaludibacillus aurantiacus TaxID=1601833 RepID=A0A1H9W936_9BACI|nr:alpha-galactosidase [Salipaludibacillus aurantiacus]SES30440.1 alpha-galactosidase [Salipaludibacillus aurantiacus]
MGIYVCRDEKRFVLETANTAYIFDRQDDGHLQHVYWGKKMPYKEDYEACIPHVIPHSSFEATRGVMGYEFIPWGEMVYSEPTLKVSNASGERGFEWIFDSYKIDEREEGTRLTVTLKEAGTNRYGVELIYDLYDTFDIIGRSQKVFNYSGEPLTLEAARSLQTAFNPGKDYYFSHLAGKWTGEFQLIREPLTEGRKTIDSRRGSTSHQANPWFAIDTGANEDDGDVWFGHFAYSGNWDIHVEKDAFGFVQVCGGLNDFDFSVALSEGESFETPVFFAGYTGDGFTGMSHLAHRFQRENILPPKHRGELRKVLYNSWEATYFDVSEAEQKRLADKAAAIGCELFVVDDGWFGERHSDQAGLGDWYVNREKFPRGLTPLIDHVHGLGMDFGIWVEPEMVNEDSELFRAHPDWVYQFSGKKKTEARNQLVLNLGKKEVRHYIQGWLDDLLQHHDIRFIKWDMNRAISEPGNVRQIHGGAMAHTEGAAEQQKLWLDHVEGLYEVMDGIKEKYPHVVVETCSGGGGRIDLGVLQRTDQFWTSDNTDAVDRLPIQYGCSYAYNAKAMMCWVTDSPNWLNQREVPLKYRFHSAMMGSLGIGGNLDQWNDVELAEAKKWIAEYKEIRATVQEGNQYRLAPAATRAKGFGHSVNGNEAVFAIQYVSEGTKEESVVFLLEQGIAYGPQKVRLQLKGLDPEALYEDNEGLRASGSYFMRHGIEWTPSEHYKSQLYRLKKVYE